MMAAPSNPNDLSLQTADHSTTPAPTPTNHFQDLGGRKEIADKIFSHLEFRDRARYASVCKRWHEIADDDSAYLRQCRRDMPDRTSMWENTSYNRYACVCKRWHEIADDDSAYLRQCRRDMPDRTSMWENTSYKGGWELVHMNEKINQFDAEHKRRVSNKSTLEAYASRPVIPYHTKNAGIEDHWKRKTSDDSWKVLDILQGAKEKKPIPRLKLWRMAKSDKVSYDVEFELACRGYMRSEKSWLKLAIVL